METLTFRAERALLGAMLRQPGLPSALHYLDAGDFTLVQHRRVFAALVAASEAAAAGESGRTWEDLVADAAGPEARPAYLEELRQACPDPSHGPAYGKLVMEASARRTLAADADDMDSQASAIGYSARRMLTARVDGGRQVEVSADYAKEVAGLLRRHATAFSPDTTIADPGRPAPASDRRGLQEERVLAALIQRPREAREAISLLSAETFTDPSRREIYQALRTMYLSGRSQEIDDLTVDWQAASERGPVPSFRASGLAVASDQPSYATTLAAAAVTGSAAQLARDLVHPPGETRNGKTLSPAAPARNGAAPVTRLIQPPPPPGYGPGPVQGGPR